MIEGYMLKYKGAIWSVKGCFHPDGYAVAIPRVYNGVKIKKMNEALELVRKKFEDLMKYVPELGFEVPLVPLKDSEVLDPFKKTVKDKIVSKFLSYFNGKVGVTGSLLYSDRYNDIDLLSLDETHYEILKNLRNEGITKELSYSNEDEVEILSKEDFEFLKKKRFLEGIFEDIPYTFKIVKCLDFGIVISKESFTGIVRITKAEKPYSLPVMYLTNLGFYLTSFRTRFTELKEGITLYVKGTLLKRDKFLDLDLDIAKEVRIHESRT